MVEARLSLGFRLGLRLLFFNAWLSVGFLRLGGGYSDGQRIPLACNEKSTPGPKTNRMLALQDRNSIRKQPKSHAPSDLNAYQLLDWACILRSLCHLVEQNDFHPTIP